MGAFDSKANFVCVDIGAYGKNSDGGVFSHSQFGKVSIVLVTLSNKIHLQACTYKVLKHIFTICSNSKNKDKPYINLIGSYHIQYMM